MATSNLDAVNLGAIPLGGTIREDLMEKINNISPVTRPFCDSIGSTDASNTFKEWALEALEPANPGNARVDGSSSDGINDTVTGERVGNYCQQATKTVRVSDRGRNVNTIGGSDELIRQLMRRQMALKRDEEASYLSRNVAIPGDGHTIAGVCAGVGSWIGTGKNAINTDRGTGGADPILSGNPGGYPTTKAAAGTVRALSETTIKEMLQAAFKNGGAPTMAVSTLPVIEIFSNYLFTSSARVATLQSDVKQSNRTVGSSGNGNSGGGVVAQGSVNIFVSTYGILELVPSLFQPQTATGTADLYLIDPLLWERAYLQGYETKELARIGLADNREISVDFTLCSLNESGSAVVADVSETLAGVA